MSQTTHTSELASVNAGDTIQWLKSLPGHPADAGWLLTYTLINAASKITFAAMGQGADHLVNVTSDTSAGWAAGQYDYRAVASKAAESYTVASGRITVKPSFDVATLDGRSQVRRTLEAIEATLEGRASSATAEYQIAGRQLKYIAIPELIQLRDRFRADVRNEDAAARVAAGQGNPGRVFVRFGP